MLHPWEGSADGLLVTAFLAYALLAGLAHSACYLSDFVARHVPDRAARPFNAIAEAAGVIAGLLVPWR